MTLVICGWRVFQVTRVRGTDPNLGKGEAVLEGVFLGGRGQAGSRAVSYITERTSSLGPDVVEWLLRDFTLSPRRTRHSPLSLSLGSHRKELSYTYTKMSYV